MKRETSKNASIVYLLHVNDLLATSAWPACAAATTTTATAP